MTNRELGLKMLDAVGAKVVQDAYGTTDPFNVGTIALGHGDMNRDGSFK